MPEQELRGMVFDIQRFSIHDGPGIRTLIFMKGCPMRCLWCANPEGIRFQKSLQFIKRTCSACGRCAAVCPSHALSVDAEGLHWDKAACTECFQCIPVCPTQSRKYCGQKYSVRELLKLVARDDSYYQKSGGGMTVGGGEPLAQPEFVYRLLKQAKEEEYLNTIFMDIKHMDSTTHEKLTSRPNERILENVKRAAQAIDPSKQQIIIRTPVIPGLNDSEENILATAEFVKSLGTIRRYELLPYHRLGESKYERTKWTDHYPLEGMEALKEKDLIPLKEKVRAIGLETN